MDSDTKLNILMAYEKKLVEYEVRIELGQEEYKRRLNKIRTEISNEFNVKRTNLHGWIQAKI